MKILTKGLIFLIIFTFLLAGVKLVEYSMHPIKFSDIIIKYCDIYDLEPSLVASLINVESSYNQHAISNKQALGLMQLKLDTANYISNITLTKNDLLDAETNIEYGCKYLRYLFNKFDNTDAVLASYNAGETRVRSWLKSHDYSKNGVTLDCIPYKETRNYVEKIHKNLKFYSRVYH